MKEVFVLRSRSNNLHRGLPGDLLVQSAEEELDQWVMKPAKFFETYDVFPYPDASPEEKMREQSIVRERKRVLRRTLQERAAAEQAAAAAAAARFAESPAAGAGDPIPGTMSGMIRMQDYSSMRGLRKGLESFSRPRIPKTASFVAADAAAATAAGGAPTSAAAAAGAPGAAAAGAAAAAGHAAPGAGGGGGGFFAIKPHLAVVPGGASALTLDTIPASPLAARTSGTSFIDATPLATSAAPAAAAAPFVFNGAGAVAAAAAAAAAPEAPAAAPPGASASAGASASSASRTLRSHSTVSATGGQVASFKPSFVSGFAINPSPVVLTNPNSPTVRASAASRMQQQQQQPGGATGGRGSASFSLGPSQQQRQQPSSASGFAPACATTFSLGRPQPPPPATSQPSGGGAAPSASSSSSSSLAATASGASFTLLPAGGSAVASLPGAVPAAPVAGGGGGSGSVSVTIAGDGSAADASASANAAVGASPSATKKGAFTLKK
jgi:hypothetical protein